MQDKIQKFRQQFAEETRERLRTINNAALELETGGSRRDLLEVLKREMHTIKGGGRILGLKSISRLAHFFEDSFQQMAAGQAPERSFFSGLFQALDLLQELLDRDESAEVEQRVGDFIHRLQQGELPVPAGAEAGGQFKQRLAGRLAARLKEAGSSNTLPGGAATVPPAAMADPGALSAVRPEETAVPEPVEQSAGQRGNGSPRQYSMTRSFRIDGAQIDSLTEDALQLKVMVSFLDLFLKDYQGLVRSLRESQQDLQKYGGERNSGRQALSLETLQFNLRDLAQLADEKGKAAARRLHAFQKYFDSFYQKLENLRLIPLTSIFAMYPRFVRDHSAHTGKEIRFEVQGGATRLDKRIAEAINDCLIHLLRNAVDHGIEPPAVRLRLGKERAGTVRLSALARGDRVLITIEDDGRGVDEEVIRETARKKKLMPERELDRLSRQDVLQLIFTPGFSTAPIITDTSGRGVGMDVVETTVRGFNGTIHLRTEKDRGTAITLELPISISTTRVLHVREQGLVFALPAEQLKEVRRVQLSRLARRDPFYFLIEGDRSLHVAELSAVIGFPPRDGRTVPDERLLLILQLDQERFGLLAEQTLHEEDIIVTPKDPFLQGLPYLAGFSVGITGEPCLVLDNQALGQFFQSRPLPAGPRAAAAGSPAGRTILLVEDSLVTREMEKVVLESAGYHVVEAVNGADALEKLTANTVHCVVTDVEMPVMDGFSLTGQIRQTAAWRDLPVVIVTTRENREDKIRGIQAGANAYITKKEFDQMQLIETIKRLI